MSYTSHTDLYQKMYIIRTALGLSQSDIAFQMNDISPAAYGKLERGEVSNPSIARFEQFAEITGLSFIDFLQETPEILLHKLKNTKTPA